MGTSGGACLASWWAAPCSVLALQVFALNFQTLQSSVVPVHLSLTLCCCSECLSQAPELWTWSQSATTAPAGFSSAPCPEVHNCSSSPAETALCWLDQVRRTVCPHRAAAESSPDPSPRLMMRWRVSCTVRCSIRTGGLTTHFWHSKWTWWKAWEEWRTAKSKYCL